MPDFRWEPGGFDVTVDPPPGDEIVPDANMVFDRSLDIDAPPEVIWPWLVQLGRGRAGWYGPRSVERFLPRSRRALRSIDPAFQHLATAAGSAAPGSPEPSSSQVPSSSTAPPGR